MSRQEFATRFLDGGCGWVIHNNGAIWIFARTRKDAKRELKQFCDPQRAAEGLATGHIKIEKATVVGGWR